MIKWSEEVLQGGTPIYNIVGYVSLGGVHFRPANEIVRGGTPFSAENMDAIAQKAQAGRYFYYGGEEAPTTDFPGPGNGMRRGIFLARAYAGMYLAAEGTVYLAADGWAKRVKNPANLLIERDCGIYCRKGEEVMGIIFREDEDGN